MPTEQPPAPTPQPAFPPASARKVITKPAAQRGSFQPPNAVRIPVAAGPLPPTATGTGANPGASGGAAAQGSTAQAGQTAAAGDG
jgi:hypothetical protein